MATAPHAVDATTLLSSPAQAAQRAGGLGLVRGLQLWHLLSLDAPSVAMLWTWFIARSSHIRLPATAVLAMGIAVWMLYAADRLLDTRSAAQGDTDLEPRHRFHRSHERNFRVGICAASCAIAVLLPQLAPQSVRLYFILGALLFAYFIVIHASPRSTGDKTRLPKELAVGVFFSAAIFIPTVARAPALRLALLPGALLFAAVCSLNCLFIYAWEHPKADARAHPATRVALRFLPQLAILVASCSILAFVAHGLPWEIPTSCAVASALLLQLHGNRRRLDSTTLRAAADLCLLTPLLLLPLMRP